MLVTTAMAGESLRKLPSDSSASTTISSPLPSLAFEPRELSLPPTTVVGSRPPAASTVATMEVVVVLPWLPAMATPYLRRISSASISARGMTGVLRALATTTSGLSRFTAEEMTTTSQAPTFSARCGPVTTLAPRPSRRRVVSESFRSLPLTA